METLVGAVLGATFLFVFYRVVRFRWPESYFGASDTAALAVSASPLRYSLFRWGPVFVTCLFVSVAVDRAGGKNVASALSAAGSHALLTNGRALVLWLFSARSLRRHRTPIALVRAVGVAGAVIVAWLATAVGSYIDFVVPDLDELAATLWTAALAGVAGAFVLEIGRKHPIGEDELMRYSRERIPDELWEAATRISERYAADVHVVRAVMMVENLQRPAWFRRLERLKGRISRRGTYGIMQMLSTGPISDEESIERAVRDRLSRVSVRLDGRGDHVLIEEFANSYNPTPNFVSLMPHAYWASEDADRERPWRRRLESSQVAPDGRPVVEVDVTGREGRIELAGTAVMSEGELLIEVYGASEVLLQRTIQASAGVPGRGEWSAWIPRPWNAEVVIVRPAPMEETPVERLRTQTVTVVLPPL